MKKIKRNTITFILGVVFLTTFIVPLASNGEYMEFAQFESTQPQQEDQVKYISQEEQTVLTPGGDPADNTSDDKQAGNISEENPAENIPEENPAENTSDANPAENASKELLQAMAEQMKILEARVVYMQSYINMLGEDFITPSINKELIQRQIAEASDLEKHMFQIEYYNACLLKVNIESLSRQQALAEKKLKLEELRLKLGVSKQEIVDNLSTLSSDLNKQMQICNEAYNSKIRFVETKRDISGYEFIGDYSMPAVSQLTAKTAEDIKQGLIDHNVSLYNCNDQIEQLNDSLPIMQGANATGASINSVRDQINNLTSQKALLMRQFEIASESKWSSYLAVKAQCDLAEMKRPTLLAQLSLLNENYRLGVISGVDRLEKECLIYEELSKADVAAINLEISTVELNAMQKGLKAW